MRPIVAIIGAIETAQSSAEVPHSITEAVAMAGGGKLGKSAIAQMLSDTSDKKSQEYKNQLRNVQRYYKAEQEKGGEGRVPSTKKGGKREALNRIFDQLARMSVKQQMRTQGASVKVSGDVRVSGDERYRTLPELFVSPDAMDKILDAYEARALVTMEDEFNDGSFDAYDLPGAHFTDIDDIEITAGATQGALLFGR